MIKAFNDDIELQFAYDGIGNRIRKIFIENSDTTVVKYTYDGTDLLFEQDDNDAVQIRYLYGLGIDYILESVDSVGTKQHFADALGSVTRITDSTGTRFKLMVYDSYGNMTSDTGSAQADYVSYTGREAERDLGIYYYRARYYDPLTGRFMARDPLGFSAGDVNLYRYVGNNPVSLRDPLGLSKYILFSQACRNIFSFLKVSVVVIMAQRKWDNII
jgi:RHS repeat-associated protein